MLNFDENSELSQLQQTLHALDKASQFVNEICSGKRHWRMSIPARLDDDPDLVIGRALFMARRIIGKQYDAECLQQIRLDDAEQYDKA